MISKRELAEIKLPEVQRGINDYVGECHDNALMHGFYETENRILWKIQQGMKLSYNEEEAIKRAFQCQKLMLIVSEVSEAMESLRNDKPEEFAEEIADCVIREMDLCGHMGIDLEEEVCRKMNKNRDRPKMHGGKLF